MVEVVNLDSDEETDDTFILHSALYGSIISHFRQVSRLVSRLKLLRKVHITCLSNYHVFHTNDPLRPDYELRPHV